LHFPRGPIDFARCTSQMLALIACLFSLAIAAPAAEVTATRLDGSTTTGELRGWEASQIVVAAPNGEQRIATDQLLSLNWPPPASPFTQSTILPGVVELTDGSEIPIANLGVQSASATANQSSRGTASLFSPLASLLKDTPLVSTIPTNVISVVRFSPLDGALAKQWEEIRSLKAPGDLLVVAKRDGASLDYVEGVVGEITNDKVEFKLDGESNRVDRAKVTGVVYSHPNDSAASKTLFVLHGRSGLRLTVTEIHLADEFVTVKTTACASLHWPVADLERADFSSGKVSYLSDIEPASQNWTPLVGLPTGVSLAAQYGLPRRNHSAFGDLLTLSVKDKDADATQSAKLRTFTKGLALRSHTELVYRLPEGFNRFTALAGIDPATASTGNVRLKILADDRSLFDAEIAGDQPPQPIDIPISNAKRLKIVVDFGQNLDTGDWLNLCDAKIVK